MKMILLVLKKEMLEIIRDRNRLAILILFNFILLPILSIIPGFVILTRTVKSIAKPLEIPVQGLEYAPSLAEFIHENAKMNLFPAEDVKKIVLSKKSSTGLIILPDFEDSIKNGQAASISVVVDKTKTLNIDAERLKNVLNAYNEFLLEDRLAQKKIPAEYLTPIVVEEFNVASASETTGSFLSFMIPGFIMTFGLTSGLSVAISSIAGEKDKQTLEPVLFTAIRRIHLVAGKLLAVLVNVFISAFGFLFTFVFYGVVILIAIIFTFKGIDIDLIELAATPTPAAAPVVGPAPVFTGYEVNPSAIILLLLSIPPIVFLGSALQIMISSIARSTEEAFVYALPLSISSLAPIFAAFFLDEFTPSLGHYVIPIFGTILAMRDLLSGHVYPASLLMMFGSSMFYAASAIAISVWMFSREEVLLRA